jgi:hypothetical protein
MKGCGAERRTKGQAMTNIEPICANCRHYNHNGFCAAPVPQWVEVQGQSCEMRPDADASDCPCFDQDDKTSREDRQAAQKQLKRLKPNRDRCHFCLGWIEKGKQHVCGYK